MSRLRLLERGVSAARKYSKERLFERVVPAARKYPKQKTTRPSLISKYSKQKTARPSLISKYSKQKTARPSLHSLQKAARPLGNGEYRLYVNTPNKRRSPLGNEEYWRHVNTLNKRRPAAPLRRKRKKAPGLTASPKTLKKIKRQRKLDNVKKKVLIGSALLGPGAAGTIIERKNIRESAKMVRKYAEKKWDSIRRKYKN